MKKIIDVVIHITIVIVVSIIVLVFILPILKFFNLENLLSKKTFDISDVIGILSLNLGILQGLMALFGMGIAAVAFVNFTQIRNKLKELEDKIYRPRDIQNFEINNNVEKEEEKDKEIEPEKKSGNEK